MDVKSENVTVEVGDENYSGQLDRPDRSSEQGVLMIPGANHGPFGDVFDRFAETAAENGHNVARFETWEDREELAGKTEADFETEISAGIEFLQSRGCSTITIVAKSFGGRLALTNIPDAVDRMVLWAPAIVFGDSDERPSVTAPELSMVEVPVRILQGDKDDVVSVANAAAIAEHLPNGDLVKLPGEDHSFLNDEQRIVESAIGFLPE